MRSRVIKEYLIKWENLPEEEASWETSNYVIWKARMLCLLDEHFLKSYVNNVMVVLVDPNPLKYRGEMAKTKRMILDIVKDHVVCNIASRGIAKEMWDALTTLYQGFFEQRNMYLE